MLGKKYRVSVQDFPRKAKTAYSGKLFVVKKSPNTRRHCRVGVIVGKNSGKKATRRNKTKRIIMDAFRESGNVLNTPGNDYLVIMSSSDKLDDADYNAGLKEEIITALDKLRK
ncbi:MAG: hypothetical protein A3C03_01670 [Candidatus Colwellbacteria bacterium RIFCSPHIGHO2_02_FULL_45_17]|uniref:Uncharacterized protein n=2 Tax=Candidatus Colwelliibacteriota TaxID=1817904 RepID=A0A1G1ZBR6_9BACT|nr:MAG: hypothetical protein A3C03_01670 [Candidatus Colwellbacteria bacterium RIFCSPHIGHO2_02_FULL_45_17]OGY60738.1 MAG: hypothetical protein A3I33_00765 [Candidatus Colwellbacteria bacterium RIFCSPLOWO2_02_FULL_45_11]OGY61964.1 MAG: hypothetical protein A3G58_00045 [Candidatus Colwellbacteria bacterium RIFCSPLOWO2_12_FULL_46_17]